jgi:hypothetical protein
VERERRGRPGLSLGAEPRRGTDAAAFVGGLEEERERPDRDGGRRVARQAERDRTFGRDRGRRSGRERFEGARDAIHTHMALRVLRQHELHLASPSYAEGERTRAEDRARHGVGARPAEVHDLEHAHALICCLSRTGR